MYKKITSIIITLILLVSFAGCSQPDADPAGDSDAGSTTESTSGQHIDTDEKLFTVNITLPASLFADQDMASFDTDAYVKEQGLISAKVNGDGSVSVTMTKGRHKELLAEMAATLDKTFAEFINSGSTPYIKEIAHDDEFTSVTIKVDRTAYESAFDFTPLAIALSVATYQAFTETEYHVEITVVDVSTNEPIKTIVYPDALKG